MSKSLQMTQVNPTMTNLLTTVSCPNCSFAIVYDTVARALQKYNINLIPCLQCIGKLVISDTRWFFSYYRYRRDIRSVLYLDTYTVVDYAHPFDDAITYVTCTDNAIQLRKFGVEAEIVPRPINEEYVARALLESRTKVYTFVTVGSLNKTKKKHKYVIRRDTDYFDRKRIDLFEKVTSKLRGITSIVLSNIPPYKYVDYQDVYSVLARSKFYVALSGAEGFGLPPVEAMAVGTPVIYLDAHAYHDWLVGIPVKHTGVDEVETEFGVVRMYDVDIDDLQDKIQYALNMNHEEYNKLARKSFEHAKKFYSSKIAEKLVGALTKVNAIL